MLLPQALVLTAFINNVLFVLPPYPYPRSAFICLDLNNTINTNCSWPKTWKQLETNYINRRYLHSIKINESLANVNTIRFQLLYVFKNRTEQDLKWNVLHIKNKSEIINKFNVVNVKDIYIFSGLYIIFLSLIVIIPLSLQIISYHPYKSLKDDSN